MSEKECSSVPFATPYIGDDEIEAVTEVLRGKWITTGRKVQEFEALVSRELGTSVALALSSGTAALDVSLAACGVEKGCDVITTPYTFVSTSLSILHRGGTPVFVDIEEDTYNIDPEKIEECIRSNYRKDAEGNLVSLTTGNLLKGIVPVHFGGHPVDIDRINSIAAEHGLFVVEDAAHAIGALYKDKPVGKSVNPVCFSFYSNKNITTGEGGMVVTDSAELEKKMRMLSLHGITKTNVERYKDGSPAYDVVYEGFKANMTDISAAIGSVQIRKLNRITGNRRYIASLYTDMLKGDDRLILPVEKNYCKSAWHLYPLRVKSVSAGVRDQIIAELAGRGVQASQHFIPVYFHSFYEKYGDLRGCFPVTEKLWASEISLPVFPDMVKEDAEFVVKKLDEVLNISMQRG